MEQSLESQHEEFLKIDREIQERKQKSIREYKFKQRNRNIGLSCYVTLSETGLPTIHDSSFGPHTFKSLKDAIDLYEMILEVYDERRKRNPDYHECDDEKENRYIFFQLESYNTSFTGAAKRKLEYAKNAHKSIEKYSWA